MSKSTGKKTIPNRSRGTIFGIQREGTIRDSLDLPWTNRTGDFIPDRCASPRKIERRGESFFELRICNEVSVQDHKERDPFFAHDQSRIPREQGWPFFPFPSRLPVRRTTIRSRTGAALCLSKRAAHAAAAAVVASCTVLPVREIAAYNFSDSRMRRKLYIRR